ncbi:MAG: TetR/AcrR family transcriptional regulator [Polyangiaceae bacterium]
MAAAKGTGRTKPRARRQPTQRRAQQTVEAVLDAVVRLLKRGGVDAVTTNRIAQVAGVSIGSVYQYFPNKRAIFLALHERHVEESGRLIERVLVDHAASSLEAFMRALIDAMADAHAEDPELYELLFSEVPHRAGGARQFEERLQAALFLALSSRSERRIARHELERRVFVVAQMVTAFAHGTALRRPPSLSFAAAKAEAVRAIFAYLSVGAIKPPTGWRTRKLESKVGRVD